MTRTAREVIDEWRNSTFGPNEISPGDWGELASRIDYWFKARAAQGVEQPVNGCSRHGFFAGHPCNVCAWLKATETRNSVEFHKPGQIPVNAPMCDKCGRLFLDCKCSSAQPITSHLSAEQHSEQWNLGYGAGYQMATEDLRVTVDRTLRPNDAADLKAALEAAK